MIENPEIILALVIGAVVGAFLTLILTWRAADEIPIRRLNIVDPEIDGEAK